MDYLIEHYPSVGTSFLDGLRAAVDSAGPLEAKTRELVLLGAYTAARQPLAFKVHYRRALVAGATVEEAKHAVLMTLGAAATLEPTVDALIWIDEANADAGAAAGS
jgi:alkylhydroperoxidase/carboxymuconolactone decarboxylase family protein YurZ